VAALAREFHEELARERDGSLWLAREARREPLEDDYTRLVDDPAACLLVGTIDAVIVGFAAATIEDLPDGTRLGVVDELFVEIPARGVGVGEALVEETASFCTARGCVGVDASALPGQRVTKNFFEGRGFRARALVMHRHLDPGS
jgi:GNAT superfamily N-acetyltransferase